MRRRPPAAVVAGAALALPLVVLLVRALVDRDPSPAGDVSLIELRTRDVGTAHNPTLGSYGRYGFNHPGPLWFDVLALPYRLTGQLEAGVLLVGLLSVAAIVWVAHRYDRLWWAAFLTAVLVWGAGPSFVADPWEPHGLLLPCAALLVLTIDAVLGRAWTLPLVVAVACVLGAAQATLLPFAIAMGATALVRARAWKPVAASAAIALVLWSPTIWQQWTGEPTNVTQLLEAPGDSGEDALGLAGGWDAVALQLGHRAPWLGWSTPTEALSPTVDLGAAPLVPLGAVALLLVLWRRRSPVAVVVLVGVVAGVVSLGQLLGPVFVWIPQWTRVLGFGCWLAVGWALLPRPPKPVLAGALAVVTVLAVRDAATYRPTDDVVGDAVRRLVHELPDVGGEPILVSSTAGADLVFGGTAAGLEVLVLELEKRGAETVVDARLADKYGPRRAQGARAGGREVLLVDADRGDRPPGFESVGLVDPLPPERRDARDRALRALGLPPDATTADVVRAVAGDPSLRGAAERLLAIENVPRLELLLRLRPGSG